MQQDKKSQKDNTNSSGKKKGKAESDTNIISKRNDEGAGKGSQKQSWPVGNKFPDYPRKRKGPKRIVLVLIIIAVIAVIAVLNHTKVFDM